MEVSDAQEWLDLAMAADKVVRSTIQMLRDLGVPDDWIVSALENNARKIQALSDLNDRLAQDKS
jgi:hypothetical protein